jgi:RND family efflux transporter MFP subunit
MPATELTPTATTRLLRRAGTVTLTLAILAGSGALVLQGRDALARVADTAPVPAPAPLTAVSSLSVLPQPGYTLTRRFTGQVEAADRTDLAFELSGRVTEVLVDEGATVRAGDTLALLDTAALGPERAALQAQRAALAADAELARLTLARADALTDLGHRSAAAQDEARLTLARLDASIAAIDAQIAGVDVRLDKSRLIAPFDAIIGPRLADPGQTVAAGTPVLTLFDAAPPRLRAGLPPDLAATLAPGDTLAVDIGGTTATATVTAIRPDLDPSTRSRAVVLTLPAGAPFGDTAALLLDQHVAAPGFWVPLDALREGARGAWTLLAITQTPQGDQITPAAVEILHATADSAYVAGLLPPGNRIVATGAHRVAPGQIVLARAD